MTRRSVYGAALVAFLAGTTCPHPDMPALPCTELTELFYSLRDDPYQHNNSQMDKLGQRNGTSPLNTFLHSPSHIQPPLLSNPHK